MPPSFFICSVMKVETILDNKSVSIHLLGFSRFIALIKGGMQADYKRENKTRNQKVPLAASCKKIDRFDFERAFLGGKEAAFLRPFHVN